MGNSATVIALTGLAISIVSVLISLGALWLTWFRRGHLAMTQPTLICFAYDSEPQIPKVFLRTLLYSTSARGQIIEAMYVKLCHDGTEQIFSFWGYGESPNLSPGSGLFVGQSGVSYNHHFVLPAQSQDYQFKAGIYCVGIFARVARSKTPIRLAQISLTISENEASALSKKSGVAYELEWDAKSYTGHSRKY